MGHVGVSRGRLFVFSVLVPQFELACKAKLLIASSLSSNLYFLSTQWSLQRVSCILFLSLLKMQRKQSISFQISIIQIVWHPEA